MAQTRTVPLPISHVDDPQVRKALEDIALIFNGLAQRIFWGTGSPETVVTAPVGCLYLRLDGGATTTLYVKTSGTGNVGWTAK